jgi:hypothetical protein
MKRLMKCNLLQSTSKTPASEKHRFLVCEFYSQIVIRNKNISTCFEKLNNRKGNTVKSLSGGHLKDPFKVSNIQRIPRWIITTFQTLWYVFFIYSLWSKNLFPEFSSFSNDSWIRKNTEMKFASYVNRVSKSEFIEKLWFQRDNSTNT